MAIVDMVYVHNEKKEMVVNESSLSYIKDCDDGKKIFVTKMYDNNGVMSEVENCAFEEQDIINEIERLQSQVDTLKEFKDDNYPE